MSWLVEMVDGQSQEFIDLQEIGGRYHRLKPSFLAKVGVLVEQAPNYRLRVGVIHSAKGSKGTVKTPFILLLITSAGLSVTFLGSASTKGGGRIIGVWPAQFQGVLKTDQDAVMNLLYIIAERPEAVRQLELVY